MEKRAAVINYLKDLGISFDLHEHPPVPTVEDALPHWKDIEASHCKNLFFRNHKGNRHYLVILDHRRQLNIRDLEQRLKQGKISFASPK
ncbi:MAG: YbaK/EbsC family protein, partial [Eudoraea sp.]|nr:YbaK/EbsC family protein [Eudoraea sp.]